MAGAEDLLGASTRGVAYWSDGSDERILVQGGTYLDALNARTGEVYPDFGDAGRVDLRVGLGEGARYRWGGAPLFTPPSIRGDGPDDTQGAIQLPGSRGGGLVAIGDRLHAAELIAFALP